MSWTIVIKKSMPGNFEGELLGTIKDCSSEDDALQKAFVAFGRRSDVFFETTDENAMKFDHLALMTCVKCGCAMSHVTVDSEFLSAICQECSDDVHNDPLVSDVEFIETVTKVH